MTVVKTRFEVKKKKKKAVSCIILGVYRSLNYGSKALDLNTLIHVSKSGSGLG